MLAFHNDPEVKQKYLNRLAEHRRLDHLVQGVMWETNGTTKGCAIGCTLEKYSHKAYEDELGIPEVLARLEDSIFEGLERGKAMKWPERFLAAIKPGANLSMIWPKIAHWMLSDPKDGVIRFAKTEKTKSAILGVIDIYDRWIAGEDIKSKDFRKAAKEASAAYAAAAYASAASAASAAAYAAYAAAAYASADRKLHWSKMADKLIKLLREAE